MNPCALIRRHREGAGAERVLLLSDRAGAVGLAHHRHADAGVSERLYEQIGPQLRAVGEPVFRHQRAIIGGLVDVLGGLDCRRDFVTVRGGDYDSHR